MDKDKKVEQLKKVLTKASKLEEGKEIALAQEFISIDEKVTDIDTKLNDLSEGLKKKLEEELVYEVDEQKIVKSVLSQVEIPEPIKGEDGKDYILTDKDKKDIASSIKVPTVEKVIEKTEVIRETPIITNEVKEVAIPETGEEIVDKINALPLEDENKIDFSHIKNVPKFKNGNYYGGSGIKEIIAGTNITVDNSNLGYPVINATGGSSVSFGTTTQIPYMNAGGTDFLYSPSFTFNGSTLDLGTNELKSWTHYLWDDPMGAYGQISLGDNSFGFLTSDGKRVQLDLNGFNANLSFIGLTSNRTYIYPDDSGTVTLGTGTANQLPYWVNNNTLGSLTTATYPSLTELSYVKGVTTAIQTQLNAKQATLVSATNIKTVNGSSLLGSGDLVVSGGWGTTGTVATLTGTANLAMGTNPFTFNGLVNVNYGTRNMFMGGGITTLTGTDNVVLGDGSALSFTSGNQNTGLGIDVFRFTTTGYGNVGIGYKTLRALTTGIYNTVVGVNAAANTNTGSYITAVGVNVLQANTSGTALCGFGVNALYTNTTGTSLAAFGNNALSSNLSGTANSAFGADTLVLNSIGTANSAYGFSSLYNSTGNYNSAYGMQSLNKTTGNYNTAVGVNALYDLQGASGNSALGMNAGYGAAKPGSYNTFLGFNSSSSLANITNATALGYNVTLTQSNTVILGDGADVGIRVAGNTPSAYLHIGAGTATAGDAPLKFTTGTNNTTAEAGAFEYNNTPHFTNSDAVRRNIVLSDGTYTAGLVVVGGKVKIRIGGTDYNVLVE